jgi:negative regulator of sigma E activity
LNKSPPPIVLGFFQTSEIVLDPENMNIEENEELYENWIQYQTAADSLRG